MREAPKISMELVRARLAKWDGDPPPGADPDAIDPTNPPAGLAELIEIYPDRDPVTLYRRD